MKNYEIVHSVGTTIRYYRFKTTDEVAAKKQADVEWGKITTQSPHAEFIGFSEVRSIDWRPVDAARTA